MNGQVILTTETIFRMIFFYIRVLSVNTYCTQGEIDKYVN